MGFFDKFHSDSGAATPPDAPASKPDLAAKPVEGFESVPPPRKRLNVVDEAPSTPPATETKAERLKRELAEAEAEEKAAAEKKAAEEAAAKKAAEEAAQEKPEGEKRGRGRPPGAKNKPKAAAVEDDAVDGSMFTKTTVSFGVTMNMGDFNSVRIDVSHTIEYGDGDAQSAFKSAYETAQQQVEAKMREIREGVDKATKKA